MEHLSPRELYEGNLEGGGSFTGDSEDMLHKVLEMDVYFYKCPALGEHGGTLLS